MRRLRLGLAIWLLSSQSYAQQGQDSESKPRQTNINPARATKADPVARLRLSQDVPTDFEKYKFVTSTKYAAEESEQNSVAAFGFDRNGKRFQLGTVPLGRKVTLDFFAQKGVTLYYRIPYAGIQPSNTTRGNTPQWAWISGRNIEVMAK